MSIDLNHISDALICRCYTDSSGSVLGSCSGPAGCWMCPAYSMCADTCGSRVDTGMQENQPDDRDFLGVDLTVHRGEKDSKRYCVRVVVWWRGRSGWETRRIADEYCYNNFFPGWQLVKMAN
ncbi:hypothetical protein BDP55DRAFT_676314 [Colletotrichum godetiae]|uniref:Uncharacterized protein n=1 Tax=Colletotrichum godetiae TaxID=1209918 RepID=A0AAJ0AF21_9PEZI|nr:uncharacterized protein BDP55DRAFT_676314 [Colletotrichum godetiae]KAK1671278.1 hypothetical protein BDP55DRAFT_676314 [Colletotrichum godetiae]